MGCIKQYNLLLLNALTLFSVVDSMMTPKVGFTVPVGDITIRHGDPLNITCNLYENYTSYGGPNASSRLFFQRRRGVIFPSEMVDVLNSTSARLYIENPDTILEDNYFCFLKQSNNQSAPVYVSLNVVVVGVPPQNVTDFECLSRNYDNLTCSWTPPENFVSTSYNLTFSLRGRAGRGPYNCPQMTYSDNKYSCFWNISTNPQYRQAHPEVKYRLFMNNTFGSNELYYNFSHFKHVLPNPPENLTFLNVTPHSIGLFWVVPLSMQSFPKGIHHRIFYQSEYNKTWHLAEIITEKPKRKNITYNLTGLKYAHAIYDIRVSIRSSVADEDRMWSNNASINVRTKSKGPDTPPRTTLGSFEILGNNFTARDVYVYWHQILPEQTNGPHFKYLIKVVEGTPILNMSKESEKSYVNFTGLDIASDYVFHIWSKNDDGLSSDRSVVRIPSQSDMVPQPRDFSKTEIDDGMNYELSWEEPQQYQGRTHDIVNYTIFWCDNERDRPHVCGGKMNWTDVPPYPLQVSLHLTPSKIYQIGIAANTETASSGIVWAECTILPNRIVSKVKEVDFSSTGSRHIEVRWKLDCTDRVGVLEGFVIYYCPWSRLKLACLEVERKTEIYGNVDKGTVSNLKPYTTYRVTVSAKSKRGTYSQQSDPKFTTTSEAAPTRPRDVRVFNINSSMIYLNWSLPARTNGVIKYYLIHYNSETVNETKTNRMLTNLSSYTNYTIKVEACTVLCSEPEVLRVTTNMTKPSQIHPPRIRNNGTYISFTWDRPDRPGGKIDYYQIRLTHDLTSNETWEIKNTTAPRYNITNCGDSGKYNSFYFSVRAVNIINGVPYEGPWSEDFESVCTASNAILLYIFLPFGIIVGALVFIYAIKRIYTHCKMMLLVEFKLPDGLATAVDPIPPWGAEKNPDDIDRNSHADEELLLKKMSEVRPLSGDSSGCSSAHGSVTSSLESATHISSTDSGTEQPSTDDLRKNSLRQRNISSSLRPTLNKGYVTMPPDQATRTTKPSQPGYCVLGVDPSKIHDTDLSYMPLSIPLNTKEVPHISCDVANQNAPYVMTGDILKATNPGYVPYNPEPTEKPSTGYVVAGLKDMLVSDLLQCETPSPTSAEEKPLYVKASDNLSGLKGMEIPWQQSYHDAALGKSGYVSVGDAPPPRNVESSKGYVPHKQFEAKILKED